MDIVILFLAVAGLSFTFVHSEIMDILKLRPLWEKWWFTKKLFHCAFCCGFYFSLLIGSVYLDIKSIIPFGFAGAAFSLLWDRIIIFLDDTIINMSKKNS